MVTCSDEHGYTYPRGFAGMGIAGTGEGEFFFTHRQTRTREPGLRVSIRWSLNFYKHKLYNTLSAVPGPA
jgi:hypothetical protein